MKWTEVPRAQDSDMILFVITAFISSGLLPSCSYNTCCVITNPNVKLPNS